MIIFVHDRVENIVGIGENPGYQYFLLFLQCFQKGFLFRVVKNQDYVVKNLKPMQTYQNIDTPKADPMEAVVFKKWRTLREKEKMLETSILLLFQRWFSKPVFLMVIRTRDNLVKGKI